MDKKTAAAVLVQLTAQTEFLGILARYYAGLTDGDLVHSIPARTRFELQEACPEAARLAERMANIVSSTDNEVEAA